MSYSPITGLFIHSLDLLFIHSTNISFWACIVQWAQPQASQQGPTYERDLIPSWRNFQPRRKQAPRQRHSGFCRGCRESRLYQGEPRVRGAFLGSPKRFQEEGARSEARRWVRDRGDTCGVRVWNMGGKVAFGERQSSWNHKQAQVAKMISWMLPFVQCSRSYLFPDFLIFQHATCIIIGVTHLFKSTI